MRFTYDAVQVVAGLSSGIDIATRKSEIVGAEGVCRIRLFRRDEATSRPFRSSIRASEHNGANDAIAIHYRAPFLIPESAVRSFALFNSACYCCLKLVVVRNLRT